MAAAHTPVRLSPSRASAPSAMIAIPALSGSSDGWSCEPPSGKMPTALPAASASCTASWCVCVDGSAFAAAKIRTSPHASAPGFGMERDWETRFQQYDINHNDRARYTPGCTLDGSCPVNFKAEMPGGGQLPVGIPQG